MGSWVSETIVSGFELETRVLLKYVPYSAAFEEGKRPAAGARGATHRVAFFSEKSNGIGKVCTKVLLKVVYIRKEYDHSACHRIHGRAVEFCLLRG